MGKRTFTITGNMSIRTRDGVITEGKEYLYRESSHLLKVVVEKVIMTDGLLELQVYWPAWKRRGKVARAYDYIRYTGMWSITDLDNKDLDQWYGKKVMKKIRETPVDLKGPEL